VAEHSFLVQLIAIEISRLIKHSNHRAGPINIEKEHAIMRWAMWHDMLEVKTGDINTPVKIHLRKVAGDDAIERVEFSYSAEFERVSKDTSQTVKDIVKLADQMEALNFLDMEGNGNHAKEVYEGIKTAMYEHFNTAKRRCLSLEWDNLKPLMKSL
jgi:5'-deoxynucleotidase YfbR-like HD superfamily hydrolase